MRLPGQKGQVLIMALLVMLIIITTVIVDLTLCGNQRTITNYHKEKVQALYYADGGIERVLAKLNEDPGWADSLEINIKTTFYNDGNVTVRVEKQLDFDKPILVVYSEGYHGYGKQTLKAVIKPGDTPQILSWEEMYPVLPD